MKRLLFFLCAFAVHFSCYGQLEAWELSSQPGNQVSSNATTTAANLGVGVLQRGAGVTASAAGGCIASSGWFASATPTTLADAIANNDYYEFTMPVNAGFEASVTSVGVIVRSSNTGPNTASLRSSVDGFTTTLGTIPVTTASVLNTISVTLTNTTGTVTFRLYGYGSAANAASNPAAGGTFRIGTSTTAADNDLIIAGTVSAITTCNLTGAGLTNVHCQDDNGTANMADDFIWFELNPAGTNLGTGYNVTVNTGSVLLNGTTAATNVPYGSSSTFRLQQGSAGAGNVTVTVTDATTGAACSIQVIVVDPGSCSIQPCSINASGLANLACNNNGTSNNLTDDYITFFLNPTGVSLGASYSLSVSSGTVTLIGGGAATGIAYGSATQFRLQNGSAGGGNVTVTITDVNSAGCTLNVPITDPGICSVPTCGITVTCPPAPSGTYDCNTPLPAPVTTLAGFTALGGSITGTPCGTLSITSTTATINNCSSTVIPRTYTITDGTTTTQCTLNYNYARDQTAPTFNPPLPANLNLSCTDNLPIAPSLTGTDNCSGSGAVPNVIWINELHYDNTGADVGEFVEVAGTAGINLADYQIILYNGNGGLSYLTTTLSGSIDNEGTGFGAVSFTYPSNGIQNGAPDGIALYQISTNMVIQFLSYEGVFQALDGPANGIFSTDVGVLELGTEAAGLSLQLTGTGQIAANFTWVGPIAQTPGTLNAGQTINPLPASIPATFMQTQVNGACAGSRIVTRTWTVSDVCGNSALHTQTINIGDNQAPILTPTPPNVTISCSDPIPTAPTVVGTDGCDPAGIVNGPVWINEIHYDNLNADVNEFVEIAGRAGTNLSGYELYFYNGSTGMMGGTYGNLALSGIIPNQSNGFGTIAFFLPVNGIENGPSDGIAFVKGATIIQFLSYEGVMTAIGGPANGLVSTDIGVAETGNEAAGQSVRLSGNGATYAAFIWNNPSAASPATPGLVNQGQTFPVQPPIGLPVSFNQVTSAPSPSCPYAYTITRTWSATDACANTAIYTQTITVQDVTAPTVTCQPLTVTLSVNGTVTVTQASITYTATDNCSPSTALVTLPNSVTYTCAQEGTTQNFVLSVRDQCNNVGTCTAAVTINPFPRCTPKILISDPCVCKNNATTLSDGQFGEQIKIESLTGKTWTVTAVNGLYTANSPAPPSAPTPVAVGTVFVENPANSGDYYLNGVHVDAIGYTITVRSEIGQVLNIGNSCQYPNPAITSDLSGPFCLYSAPVTLTGTPGDANITSQGFTINGQNATVFDPGAGVGQYTIVYTVNGGTPKAAGPNDPGCTQSVSQIVNVVATPATISCNDLVYVSLDVDCVTEILPDDILEGTYGCDDDYIVELDKTAPYGNGPWVPATVGISDVGQTYQVRITHLVSNNHCWGNVKVEDKLEPVIECTDIDLSCPITTYDPAYLLNVLGIADAYPDVTECSAYTLSYVDTWHDLACNQGFNGVSDLSAYVARKWTAKDAWNNTATCIQYIYFHRVHVGDVDFPADYVINCGGNINTHPSVTGTPYYTDFGINWNLFPDPGFCELQAAYVDQILPVCDGSYKILRKWTLVDWCLPTTPYPPTQNPLYYVQLIKVLDSQGPAMVCPANLTVSTDPYNCCATTNLPDVIIEDNCSRVNNIGAMVTTFDPFTGDQTGMYTVGGNVMTFPGNNYWDLDTLGNWGVTPCLPIGRHTVVYTAEDDCGNTSTCSFRLSVADWQPPVAACDQYTVVAIGADDPADCYTPADGCDGAGVTWVHAKTFDDGSTDNCNGLHFTIRRMDPYSDCINGLEDCEKPTATEEQDSIKFYCCEVGTTQTVIMRVYQVDLDGYVMNGADGNPLYNECMVNVEVQDKIKPVCVPPANVTVACENFDASLWVYGKATVLDNCCLDTTKVYQEQCGLSHSANYNLFDTVCNKGTITRTFKAYDCHGLTSQCTQRVVVQYNQDYFVKFPNDVIVTVCDGTGNYGEPTFFGEDCELLGVSYEDQVFTVVPDACFKIERVWTIINWCTYNPNVPCIEVPNPNPNAISNNSANLPGPIVSRAGTLAPWAPTVVKINPTDATATNYSTFWQKEANCYKYKQIIKVIDTQDPVVENCPASPVEVCDITPNDPLLWNESYWWDNLIGQHDLCEGPTDLTITATDACSAANINFRYLLFLDLDNDGTMETVINSVNTGIAGLGWNAVPFGNGANPNYTGGTIRAFDGRPVPFNQKYGFAIQTTTSGTKKTASVRWNTQQSQNNFVIPELPYGTHKIKWFVEDGCGNESVCEYTFIVKDCKKPTVVCLNGLSVNIMPTQMIQLWASDFLKYTEDNCTPADQLKIAIRKSGTGTGFPVDGNGNPITNVTFTCDELGTQLVELWSIDKAGNADFCETYVIVQDNNGNCPNVNAAKVAGALATEATNGLEEGSVQIAGSSNAVPSFNFTTMSDNAGAYNFNAIPLASNSTVTPAKDDNPLNGVSTYDLVLISKHILGIEALNTPYKMIAADANKSNSITTFDIVELRKLILGIYSELPTNTSWRFVDKSFAFPNTANPFQTQFAESKAVQNLAVDQVNEDFVSVKVGDVNGTAIANSLMSADDRSVGTLLLDVTSPTPTLPGGEGDGAASGISGMGAGAVHVGQTFTVNLTPDQLVAGYQFTLNMNGLEVVDVTGLKGENYAVFADAVTFSVDGQAAQGVVSLTLKATKSGKLSEMMSISSRITKAEAYPAYAKASAGKGALDVALRFNVGSASMISGVGFELYQNQPNPFVNKTVIGFHLPALPAEARSAKEGEPNLTTVTLSIYDETGRTVFTQNGNFAKGYNTITIDRALLNTTGMLYYKLETATDSATKKMIQSK